MKNRAVSARRSLALVVIVVLCAIGCGGPSQTLHDGSADATDASRVDGSSMLDVADARLDGGLGSDAFDASTDAPMDVALDVPFDAPPDIVDAGCTGNASCTGDPGGHGVCDTTTGRCVECIATADTCATGTYCDGTTDHCVPGCRDDAECVAGTGDGGAADAGPGDGGVTPTRCDTTHHVCVQCLGDTDCPSGNVCAGSVCSPGCNAGHACPTGLACCGTACVDEQSNTAHCGACNQACSAANGTSTCTTGACAVGACTSPFADCDGVPGNGCEVDTSSDPTHCGGCSTPCPTPANATPTCASATCGYTCTSGFADCDGLASNGCEVNLNLDPTHCGTCSTACAYANGMAACSAGTCAAGTCSTGYADCDHATSNGCETNLGTDPNNCSACGNVCAFGPHSTAVCTGSSCGIVCESGYADCDHIAANGCEVNIASTVGNCGACGAVCSPANATPTCMGGVCAVATCNAGFADCDGSVANGCEVNLTTDPNHCGGCATPCAVPNATPVCTGATCAVGTCNGGFADCDHDPANGCEVNTATSIGNCGACNAACSRPNAVPTCMAGMCAVQSCNGGFADCDHVDANGCEVSLNNDPNNCHACGIVCNTPNAVPLCGGGTCQIGSCAPGFQDCDFNPADGCETNALADPNNCGGCGIRCNLANATSACAAGMCAVAACNPGFTDCNGNPLDGCETATSADPNHCGTCGRVCSEANGTAGCAGGACTVAACNTGFQDCNLQPADGCETNVLTNVNNCGACGHPCSGANATDTCSAGACAVAACNAGFADCDHQVPDGCETNVSSDPNNCGACGHLCTAAHASTVCGGASCLISSCAANYFDVDGVESDGCECTVDGTPRTCSAAGSTATLTVGGGTTINGNVPATTVSDWFEVTFTGNTNRAFHPSIQFTTNPGNVMRFDVYANCTGSLMSCGTEGGSSATLTQWEQLYNGGGASTDPGFNPIPLPGTGGTVWIRVWRQAAAPVAGCGNYTLVVSE